MSAHGAHAQGVNPLVLVDLYSKVKVQIVHNGSELWNNIWNADMSAISQFQNKAVKRLQGLPMHTSIRYGGVHGRTEPTPFKNRVPLIKVFT